MNKKRIDEMEKLSWQVDEFQQQIIPQINAILIEEKKANEGMNRMPTNWRGEGAMSDKEYQSEINIQALEDAIEILDKKLSEVSRTLTGAYV